MQTLAWYQGELLKRLLQGAAVGVAATLAIGFGWGRVDARKHGKDPGGQHGQ